MRESPTLATTQPSSPSATAVTVVLIPAIAGRHPAMKPIVSLPRAMPAASASSRRSLQPALVDVHEGVDQRPARDLARRRAADAVGDRREPRAGEDGVLVVGPPADVGARRALEHQARHGRDGNRLAVESVGGEHVRPSSAIRRASTGIATGSGATVCSQTGKSRVP